MGDFIRPIMQDTASGVPIEHVSHQVLQLLDLAAVGSFCGLPDDETMPSVFKDRFCL